MFFFHIFLVTQKHNEPRERKIKMGYSCLRVAKIKSTANLAASYKHNYRIAETKNADPQKRHLNDECISLNGKTYGEAFQEKIENLEHYENHKIRKNATYAIEVITSFSREDIGNVNIEEWKKDNAEWLQATFNANREKYGNNVISMMIHNDEEGNIHSHAMVIPIDANGKLNASYYIDGADKLRALQDSYGQKMERNHNLKRGIAKEITRADHQDVKHFYANMNAEYYSRNLIPEPSKDDTLETYREKVLNYSKDLKGSHLREMESERQKVMSAEKRIEDKINNETIKLHSENKALKKELKNNKKDIRELERTFGELPVMQAKLKEHDELVVGLNEEPDSLAKRNFLIEMERLRRQGEEVQEKERKQKRKKERSFAKRVLGSDA